MRIGLLDESGIINGNNLSALAARWKLEHDNNTVMALVMKPSHLELQKRNEPALGGILVNFSSKTQSYRRKFGGGIEESISKAVGITREHFPSILDATAGLARDAFVLASCGCRVQMLERNPVILALLEDGLRRGYADLEIGSWLRERLILLNPDGLLVFSKISPQPDVVYLDPMYPKNKKSALAKKEMRILQCLVGQDEDSDELLKPARALAKQRVVVKRPNYAKALAGMITNKSIKTKKHRFDIYPPSN
ncbi:Ribosomal RNA small subunit methyltransferase J [Candidatus Erwinia haradaeae]|uniref:Ribosomal RNA small subunit methyltransferase J n=1 Tax=Candidatus Erwinia haradaeae TaxID=1922217 RepID=A0A451DJG6_9GAMM|nr:class I SAM-dependent methyltransferase [Candidatus Erwinia haradaeae]VFP86857.1 Ribosomal RNA small subunit methyltransferase J [Candidatus Erwinia haradaeae]